jgi:ResB-like family
MTFFPDKKPGLATSAISTLFCSLYTTVISLLVLCVLVLRGTLYQVDHGIYAAKARFFSAWIVMIGGFLPFPGVRLAVLCLILNQAAILIFKQQWRPAKAGLIVTHLGILVLLIGGGIVSYTAKETFLDLWEGETSGEALSYRDWELATWTKAKAGAATAVRATAFDTLRPGQTYPSTLPGATIAIESVYKNCAALMPSAMAEGISASAMQSSVDSIEAEKPAADPSDNVPGAVITAAAGNGHSARAVLYGGSADPVRMPLGGDTLYCSVRRRPHPLPLSITLVKFVKEDYAGTQTARQFKSTIRAKGPDIDREVVISMNKPFRYRQYTFYQSSYSLSNGRQSSTLAVVENKGKWLPYIAGLLMAFGLLVHFGVKLVFHIRKQKAA